MEENLIEEVKILNNENDIFGTYEKSQAICGFLELEENRQLLEKNNLIAIYGTWGIGKSSVMKTIQNSLSNNSFDTIWFNTWKYEKDTNLAYSLFKYIIKNKCLNNQIQNSENILENGYNIFKSMGKCVDFDIGFFNIRPKDALDEIEKRKCLWEKIEEFEDEYKKINCNDKRLVVFLDDLDRCESENIINLISSIKLLFTANPNIIFIIGIDKEAVTLALQNKYNNDFNKADEYLEKIFPINFSIDNNIDTINFKKYLQKIMQISEEEAKVVLRFFYEISFNNSRHIKKVLRKYISIKSYLIQQEVDLTNIYNIILVLYFIIMNMFYYDEYKHLIMEDKEKAYKEIEIVYYDNRTGMRTTKSFKTCHGKSCNFKFDILDTCDIYKFLIRFSSYKIKNNQLNSIINIDNSVEIVYNSWLEVFGYNICSCFMEFIMGDYKFREIIFKNKEYDDKKIFQMIRIINNII